MTPLLTTASCPRMHGQPEEHENGGRTGSPLRDNVGPLLSPVLLNSGSPASQVVMDSRAYLQANRPDNATGSLMLQEYWSPEFGGSISMLYQTIRLYYSIYIYIYMPYLLRLEPGEHYYVTLRRTFTSSHWRRRFSTSSLCCEPCVFLGPYSSCQGPSRQGDHKRASPKAAAKQTLH